MPQIIETLEKQKEEIYKYILKEKYIITIGTTGAICAKDITTEDGESYEGLGLFNMTVKERSTVIGDDLYFTILNTKQEIIGSQIQMIDVELKEQSNPLGYTNYGYGNNKTGIEGAREKNLIYTNCLGPVFVKNPWWVEEILKDIVLNKYLKISKKEEYDLENESYKTIKRFINEKSS